MKLTKEEYIRYILILHHCLCYHEEDDSLFDILEKLEQLINDRFGNPEITSISAYRILKYKIDELEKALDKACDYLTYLSNQTEEVMFEDGITNTDKEFWKEYLLND
jgi:hypothetical protein